MCNNNKINELIICVRRYIKDFQSSYGKVNAMRVVSNVNT